MFEHLARIAAAAGVCAALAATQARIVVNEFLALNHNGLRDEAGELEDWIELANVSNAPVVVSGMYLTDRLANPTKWQIPSGWTLPPGGKLLVWADEDGTQGPLHANFRLAAAGEEIAVVDTDGTTFLDQLQFGAQVADVSTGRFSDGSTHWCTLLEPTPGRPNDPPGCGARRYSALDPTLQPLALGLQGTPGLGQTVTFAVRGGAASSAHVLLYGFVPDESAIPGLTTSKLLLGAPVLAFPTFVSDGTGAADVTFAIPQVPALVGAIALFEAFTVVASALVGSNGLVVEICP